jgi:hypothetical protein
MKGVSRWTRNAIERRGAVIEEFWPGQKAWAARPELGVFTESAQPHTSSATWEPNVTKKSAMRKLAISTVAIAAILVAATIANAVFFPVPAGPISACPFGAIRAVILNVASGR